MTDQSVPGMTAAIATAARVEELELENFRLTGALQVATYKLQAWRDVDGEALMLAERRGMDRAESIARKAANDEDDFDRMAGMLKAAELIRAAGKAGA